MAKFLNYKFSKLGCFFLRRKIKKTLLIQKPSKTQGPKRNANKGFVSGLSLKMSVKKEITNLNANKLPGPSDLSAWALNDGRNEIYRHLTFLTD